MSSSSASTAVVPDGAIRCECGKADCQQLLYLGAGIIGGEYIDRRTDGRTPCCGRACNMMTDKSHHCVICDASVCGICGIGNLDKSDPEPLKINVFCDRHSPYCISHGIPLSYQPEIPAAASTSTTENLPEGWEEGYDAFPERKQDPAKKKHLVEHLVKTATWNSVRATQGFTNPLNQSGQDIENSEKNTNLKGFLFEGVGFLKIENIPVGSLRTFCSKHSVKVNRVGKDGKPLRAGKYTKKDAADAIAAMLPQYELAKAKGQEDAFSNNAGSGVDAHFNKKRYLNVLTSDAFSSSLLALGGRLDKDDLTDGLKTNEISFRKFLKLYNDHLKYNESKFDSLGFDQDASKFTPFPENDWQKASKKFKDISSEYNTALNSQTQSGHHGPFGELSIVETQPWLDYLHHCLEEKGDCQALRKAMFSELPDDVFSDSTQGAPRNRGGRNRGGRENRGNTGDRGGRDGDKKRKAKSCSEDKALESMTRKNTAQANMLLSQHKGHLHQRLNDESQKKADSKKELLARYGGDKDMRKEKIGDYKKFKASEKGDDSDEEEELFSQQSVLAKHFRASENVNEIKSELDDLNKKKKNW